MDKNNYRKVASSLSMGGFDVEQLLYNAERAASSLASISLNDPTSVWTSFPVMYGAGLLTSISPCVWGLLPLTVSYISTAAGEREDKQALVPTVAFATGLASVFCTLGLIAATVGGVFGSSGGAAGNAGGVGEFVVAALSSGVCLVMGLQLLNIVNIPLPSFEFNLPFEESPSGKQSAPTEILLDGSGTILPQEDSQEENQSQAGAIIRTFLLGGSSALVASPCATPVLTSILAYVAKAQNPALGVLYLFVYTIGYSTPLLVVAATGGQALANMKGNNGGDSVYSKIAPWVSPLTAGVLLYYGTNGLLYALFGDPSLAGLAPVLY
eukprot:CAMPEP_0195280518 /NCGR_PEP_ID=MMETSP0707-20130614/152_1 /TAXON_ID=33640 /ORGANISM="Asterionellopsis glacialis, Strain CCMP134" /LENGTH=324 /DNA_ID=CAMNT_0040339263 /DNA_START=226 /DNA_END=1200 /DNA_ORIENTATION=-